jgi:anthranilate phosphoribosyltransferase
MQMTASRNLKVSGAAESREKIFEALGNHPGPAREIVALNAGTALYAAGVADSIASGLTLARETIASGAARAKLDDFVRVTRQLGAA